MLSVKNWKYTNDLFIGFSVTQRLYEVISCFCRKMWLEFVNKNAYLASHHENDLDLFTGARWLSG